MAARPSKKKQKSEAPNVVATRVAEMKEGIIQMESLMREAAALATAEVQRIDGIKGSLEETVARLGAEIKGKEEMLREKDFAQGELEKKLTAQIRDLEIQIGKKDELLASREAEIVGLQSKLDGLQVPPEGSVTLGEENVVLLEEVEQGPFPGEGTEVEHKDFAGGAGKNPKTKVIEQSMLNVAVKPGKMAKREAGADPKNSRLVFLLAPIKKKN